MFAIFLKTLPFFAIVGIGYFAGKARFFDEQATAYLNKFVFYFALSAMILKFSSQLALVEILNWRFLAAYFAASCMVYLIVAGASIVRRVSWSEAAIEAHTAVSGNLGFIGLPMLVLILGTAAIAPILMIIIIDLVIFGSLAVIIITVSKEGSLSTKTLKSIGIALIKNPMIMSMVVGLLWSATNIPLAAPVSGFLGLLGAAATPCALFAIGASLAPKSAERISVAIWISTAKLILHPCICAIFAFWVFEIEPFLASVMVACAALPVAGNVYLIAQHYNVAPARVSSAILVSTVASIVTLSIVLSIVSGG